MGQPVAHFECWPIAALDILLSEEYGLLRSRLRRKQQQILEVLDGHGLDAIEPRSHIIAVPMEETAALGTAKRLFEQGILVNAAIFPAVPAKQGVVRFTPSVLHTEEDVAALDVALGTGNSR